ncbi:MAG TPA: STAS domain-containing protein [Herpetosiphonaceae bacterium]
MRDVRYILDEPSPDVWRWYDTYDGTHDETPDWYALSLPQESDINTIFFVHGSMVPVGGWWKTLQPQYLDAAGAWQPISSFTITPTYDFRDERGNRQPFEPFLICFPSIWTRGVRLFGQPGGDFGITTLAYLAAGTATPEQALAYLDTLRRPSPPIFQLLPPNTLWNLMASIRDVTRIGFDVRSSAGLGLDHFLDEEHFKQFHAQDMSAYDRASLYQLIGTREGWERFGAEMRAARAQAITTQLPVIEEHHGGMAWIIVPVVVNGLTIGTIENRNLVCRDRLDAAWHAAAPQRLGIDRHEYEAALHQIPVIQGAQLEAVVQLLRQIVDLSQRQIHQRIEVTELRHTVDELAVPVLPVWQGVLTVPLIGQIDERRAQQLLTTVLQQIRQQRTRVVIVDVTGVVTIDPPVVAHIVRLAEATQLLGGACFVSGVRPEVAVTLVSAGVAVKRLRTFANLQTALSVAIGM